MPSDASTVTVFPEWKTKARGAAERILCLLGLPPGGVLCVDGSAPVGSGQGSSTSDVTATVLSVAGAYGVYVDAATIAAIAVAVERACDSIMYGVRPLLFAHRTGEVVEDFGVAALPAMWVAGFEVGPPVDTLELEQAPYDEHDLETFEVLRDRLRVALRAGSVAGVGEVATESALRNQQHLPKPGLNDILRVAGDTGAAGIQVAHSGSGVGLLYDAALRDLDARFDEAFARLSTLSIRSARTFHTCPIANYRS